MQRIFMSSTVLSNSTFFSKYSVVTLEKGSAQYWGQKVLGLKAVFIKDPGRVDVVYRSNGVDLRIVRKDLEIDILQTEFAI